MTRWESTQMPVPTWAPAMAYRAIFTELAVALSERGELGQQGMPAAA